ncbi:MAG: segregation/condensation protein A [Polyangiaceae bacterium]
MRAPSPPADPSAAHAAPDIKPPAAPILPGQPEDENVFDGQYRIKLESFEGPLDLLLHLIQQHELDILNIPVSFITAKYLEYLKLMQVLSIEIASEYLVMAATLVHIKSKMLLPAPPAGQDDGMPQEEEEDPRAELVRRLLEYQKYKTAAAELAERGTLGRDVFARGVEEASEPGPAPFARVEVFGLLEAFEKLLKKSKVKIDHEVVFDRISITDRIVELTEKLQGRRAVRFEWLFLGTQSGTPTRFDLVITFLAMLEMCRMKLLQVYQTGPLAPIYMGLLEETPTLTEEELAQADQEAATLLSSPSTEEEHAESAPQLETESPPEQASLTAEEEPTPDPGEPVEPINAAEPSESAEPSEAVESSEAVEAVESSEAVEAVESSARQSKRSSRARAPEPGEPVEPINAAEPSESAEPSEAVESSEAVEASAPEQAAQPEETAAVSAEVTLAVVAEETPAAPEEDSPVESSDPVHGGEPVDPVPEASAQEDVSERADAPAEEGSTPPDEVSNDG